MDQSDRDGVQIMQLLAPLPPGRDQTGLLQQLEMLHDAEARHRQPLLERLQCLSVLLEELVEQLSARGVRERFEHIVHGSNIRDLLVTCQVRTRIPLLAGSLELDY